MLARWVDDESAAELTMVLACWRDFESASGLTAVLANRRHVESAVELTTGLLAAWWCNDESAAGRTAVLALLARWLDKSRRRGGWRCLITGATLSQRRG